MKVREYRASNVKSMHQYAQSPTKRKTRYKKEPVKRIADRPALRKGKEERRFSIQFNFQ